MSDSTVHGLTLRARRSRRSQIAFVVFVFASAVSVAGQQPAQQQKPPGFRVGAHLVTLDADPTSGGGQNIKELKPDDLRGYRDGQRPKGEPLQVNDYHQPPPP